MSQEIEIEFKTMLTKEEFFTLREYLPFPKQAILQINHYFETKSFALKDKHSALRIREKEDRFTLTLKEPHPEGILETHDSLTKEVAYEWLNGKPIPQQYTNKQLQNLNIEEADLHYYGALTTKRYTYHNEGIDYMLDESSYHGIVDYELEIEATSRTAGLDALKKLLQTTNIVERKAEAKIARFFNASR